MNVLLITKHLNIGGVAKYTLDLARELKRNDIGVFVVSSGGRFVDELERSGIKHFCLKLNYKNEFNPKVLFLKEELIRIIKQFNIDIIHAQRRTTSVLSYFSAKECNIPYITTCHGFYKVRFFRKLFPFWGKVVIAVSEYVERQLIDKLGVDGNKVKLINNGIDIGKFSGQITDSEKAAFKKKLGINKNGPIIGYIARLVPVKGQVTLIRAFSKIIEIKKDASLLIVGDGLLRNSLIQYAKELSIEKDVVFCGELSDTKEALATMDVFCFPSQKESFGLVVLEAMASGVPVVASCIDGIKTIVKDGVNGFLVEPIDYQGFADKTLMLLNDNGLYERIRDEAFKTVRENFTLARMAEKTIEVYRQILK